VPEPLNIIGSSCCEGGGGDLILDHFKLDYFSYVLLLLRYLN
jgi:hypothetical protein